MAKFATNTTYQKVPLSSLQDIGNVRLSYDDGDIAQLATSILQNGLLNPISVRPAVENPETGDKTYDIIAGHRRYLALQKLCKMGHDFNLVEVCIRPSGELTTLQLIENVQRTDLTPKEKEAAIQTLMDQGNSQADIARMLAKPIQWVSDIVAGAKVRQNAEESGINTDGISTKAMSQLRSLPQEEQIEATQALAEAGGTVKAATEILHEYQGNEEESPMDIEFEENPKASAPTSPVIQESLPSETNVLPDSPLPQLLQLIEAVTNTGDIKASGIAIKHFGKTIPVKNVRWDKKTKNFILEADEASQRLHETTDQAVDLIRDEEVTAQRLIVELSKIGPKTPVKIRSSTYNFEKATHLSWNPTYHYAELSDFLYPKEGHDTRYLHLYRGEPK